MVQMLNKLDQQYIQIHLSIYISFCLVYLFVVTYFLRKSKMNNANVNDHISFWENERLFSIFHQGVTSVEIRL